MFWSKPFCQQISSLCQLATLENKQADSVLFLEVTNSHSIPILELQELVDRLDRVSRKYSLLINVDNTKVMASDGIAWRVLI